MKIAAFELFKVPPRWLFLKLTADNDVFGWGEPIVEGHTAATAAAVQEACGELVGWDAARIEDIWQYLYRGRFYRGGPILMSVIAGIDQALGDLKGRSLGVPVHELLGGRVRVYSWIGGDTPAETADRARARVAAGFTAVKMSATAYTQYIDSFAVIDEVVTRIGAVREATGRGCGISESRRIAAMAEAHDVAVALHCPLGPMALASCLQLDATTPNAFIQEQSLNIHYHQGGDLLDYLADGEVFTYRDGYVALPTRPGLGIEIDEAKVRKAAGTGHNWKNPLWSAADGTVAER